MSKRPDVSQRQGLSELRDLSGGRRGAPALVCLKAFIPERSGLSSFKATGKFPLALKAFPD